MAAVAAAAAAAPPGALLLLAGLVAAALVALARRTQLLLHATTSVLRHQLARIQKPPGPDGRGHTLSVTATRNGEERAPRGS